MINVIEPISPKPIKAAGPICWKSYCASLRLQHCGNLSEDAMEDALFKIASMRLFTRLSLDNTIPDCTTIMNFHNLLD